MQFLHCMYSGINPDGVSFSQTHKLWLICQINGGEGRREKMETNPAFELSAQNRWNWEVLNVVWYQVVSFTIILEIENFSDPLVAFKRLLKNQTKEFVLQCELWINEISSSHCFLENLWASEMSG